MKFSQKYKSGNVLEENINKNFNIKNLEFLNFNMGDQMEELGIYENE